MTDSSASRDQMVCYILEELHVSMIKLLYESTCLQYVVLDDSVAVETRVDAMESLKHVNRIIGAHKYELELYILKYYEDGSEEVRELLSRLYKLGRPVYGADTLWMTSRKKMRYSEEE